MAIMGGHSEQKQRTRVRVPLTHIILIVRKDGGNVETRVNRAIVRLGFQLEPPPLLSDCLPLARDIVRLVNTPY